MSSRKHLRLSATYLVMLLLCGSACRAPSTSAPPPVAPAFDSSPEKLRASAETLWTARVQSDRESLYAFQPSTYRTRVDLATFSNEAAEGAFQYLDFELGKVETRDGVGWVDVKSRTALTKFPDIPPRTIRRWETWIVDSGRWRPCTLQESDEHPQAPSLRLADEEAILRARFAGFGNARVSTDYAFIYTFIDPADRERLSYEDFAKSEETLRILAAEPVWVEVVGDEGRVRATYLVASPDPSLAKLPPKEVQVTEKWHKEGGTWYRDIAM